MKKRFAPQKLRKHGTMRSYMFDLLKLGKPHDLLTLRRTDSLRKIAYGLGSTLAVLKMRQCAGCNLRRQAKFADYELDPCDEEVHLGCDVRQDSHQFADYGLTFAPLARMKMVGLLRQAKLKRLPSELQCAFVNLKQVRSCSTTPK
jgi:hypothetical protein